MPAFDFGTEKPLSKAESTIDRLLNKMGKLNKLGKGAFTPEGQTGPGDGMGTFSPGLEPNNKPQPLSGTAPGPGAGPWDQPKIGGGGKGGFNFGQFAGFAAGAAGAYAGLKVGSFLFPAAADAVIGSLPDTITAVNQRKMSQLVASYSGRGFTPTSVLRQANAANRGAFTSSTSMAASAEAFLLGGYSFGSGTVQNNLKEIGGMSVITGMENEQVAAGMAMINGMNFMRVGIRARNNDGSLRPISQIGEELYRRMYGGRQITPEQAAHVFRPTSNAYQTIAMVAGGDANLMSQLQAYIVMRAKKGKKLNLKKPEQMMKLMGYDKDSPERAEFGAQTAEAKYLQSTEKSLVGGYVQGLDTTAALTRQFERLASAVGPVADAFQLLAKFKGFGESLLGATNTGQALFKLLASLPGVGGMFEKMFGGGPPGPTTGGMGTTHTNGMGGPPSDTKSNVASSNVLPVPKGSRVSSNYGNRIFHGKKDFHGGIDYGVPIGTPVFAVKDGVARKTGTGRGYGKYVQIVHPGGYSSYYAHLSRELVSDGQRVKAGQLIGKSGNTDDLGRSTGPHLHFEIKKNGNSVNPAMWLGGAKKQGKNDGGFIDKVKSFFGGFFGFFGGNDNDGPSGKNKMFTSMTDPLTGDTPYYGIYASGLDYFGQTADFLGSLNLSGKDMYEEYHGTSKNTIGSSTKQTNTNIRKVGGKYHVGKVDPNTPLTNAQLMALLLNAGFRNDVQAGKSGGRSGLHVAMAVARAESGGRQSRVGDTTIQGWDKYGNNWGPSYGIFQIRSLKNWKERKSPHRRAEFVKDIEGNVESAYKISSGGRWWYNNWTTHEEGKWKDSLIPKKQFDNLYNQVTSSVASYGTGGSSHDSRSGMTINMNVHIERASESEAVNLANKVKQILESDNRYNSIGAN